MASFLEDILPESLIPSGYKDEYNTLKRTIENLSSSSAVSKRVKEAIITDMNEILNAIPRDTLKQDKLTKLTNMLNNIKSTKHSETYVQQNKSSLGREDNGRSNSGSSYSSE